MKTKFYNKNGDLTRYSFACGYIQRKENNNKYKEIFMEYRHFHVKSGKISEKWEVWECFDNELTKARKFYNLIKI